MCLYGNHCDSSGYQGTHGRAFLSQAREVAHPPQASLCSSHAGHRLKHCPPHWHSTASYRTTQASQMAQIAKKVKGYAAL